VIEECVGKSGESEVQELLELSMSSDISIIVTAQYSVIQRVRFDYFMFADGENIEMRARLIQMYNRCYRLPRGPYQITDERYVFRVIDRICQNKHKASMREMTLL